MGLYRSHVVVCVLLVCVKGGLSNSIPRTVVSPDATIQIAENTAINTTLFTVNATDPDGDRLTAVLDEASIKTKLFELHVTNYSQTTYIFAAVRLKGQLDVDYTSITQYTLQISINDGQIAALVYVTLYIADVNDVAPQFQQLPYNFIVNENTDVNSVVYTRISTVDPDGGLGGIAIFNLTSVGSTPDEVFSVLQGASNNANIQLVQPLDYETINVYQYIVTATDGGGLSGTASVFIYIADVQDSPPYFTGFPYLASVSEGTAVGTSVFQVHAQDQDRGVPDRIQYSVTNENCPGIFHVNTQTGDITLTAVPDRDSGAILRNNGQCTLNIRADELDDHPPQLGQTTADQRVTITVNDKNDNSPVFTSNAYTASVMENAVAGVAMKVSGDAIHVSDKDQGSNGQFRLRLLQYSEYFEPEPRDIQSSANVVIRVKDGSILDYETRQTLTFTLVAEESRTNESRSDNATVTILINNTNDQQPVFSKTQYTANLPENSPRDTSVVTLNATDGDLGEYGEVTYAITDGSEEFQINPNSGLLSVKDGSRLDREVRDTYYLTVEAEDGGGRKQSVPVVVTLTDVNDHSPEFLRQIYFGLVSENELALSWSVKVMATDGDKPDTSNSRIRYSITSDPLPGVFQINATSGDITLTRAIDYEELQSDWAGVVTLTVMASDSGSPPRTATASVKITVEAIT